MQIKLLSEKNRKLRIKKSWTFLGRFPASMLKDELRNNGGHPKPEWGEGETWRSYYLKECSRRGIELLSALGWPTDEKSLYVNIHTGGVENLFDIATTNGYFADHHTIASQVWSVIEHCEPYDSNKPNCFRIEYLEQEIKNLNKEIKSNNRDQPIKYIKERLKTAILELEKKREYYNQLLSNHYRCRSPR